MVGLPHDTAAAKPSIIALELVKVVVAQLHSHAGTTGAAKLALDMFSEHPPIDLCASLSLGLDRIG